MANVQLEAARIPDRDRMLALLQEHGLDAHAVDEVGIAVPCDDAAQACDGVLADVEHLVMRLGAPFVPLQHEGTIYLRPPIA